MKRSIEYRLEQKVKHGEKESVEIFTETGSEVIYSDHVKKESHGKKAKVMKGCKEKITIEDEIEY